MTSDLSPDCRQDSPRLAWMKRHGINVRSTTPLERAFCAAVSDIETADKYLFVAFDKSGERGGGETEDEALESLAQALGIPLWNEEQYAKEHK